MRYEYISDHIPISYNKRPGDSMIPTSITIHSTANPGSSARNERDYLGRSVRYASYHIVVDDTVAIEAIPLNEIAYHSGDAAVNMTSLSIEICILVAESRRLENAIELTSRLMNDYGFNIDQLYKHNDWTNTSCPSIFLNSDIREEDYQTWEWFVEEVEKRLNDK